MTTPKTSIQYRPIAELHELKGNPRIIKKDQFEKLKTSIKNNQDYFEARPCILSNRTGIFVVIAGNQRLKAAQAVGLKEVPTVLLEGLTEEREREIIARDNVENGEWDYDILANEWDANDLAEWGVSAIVPKIDWDNVPELTDETYEAPEHAYLRCPKCGHVDRKEHYIATKGNE